MRAPRARNLAALLALLLVACGGASGRGLPAARPGAEAVPAARPPAASAPGAAGDASLPTPPNRPAPLERVKVAVSAASLSFLPLYVARSLGLFEAEGLDAELVVMRSDLQVAGLLSGEVQYTGVGGDPIAVAVAEGAPLRTILVAFDATHFTLVGQRGIDARDLKGARVGVSRLASASHNGGRALVSYAGLNPDADVTFLSTGETSTSYAALEARSIDAAVLSPPFSSELISQGYAALARASDLPDKVLFNGLATSLLQLQNQPGQVVRMLRALLAGLAVIAHDRPRILDHLVREWDVAPEAAGTAYDETTRPLRPDGRMSDLAIQQYLDRLFAGGLVSRPLTAAEVVDFSFLGRVAAR